MIPAFAPLFTGELAIYGDRLALSADEPPPASGRDLVDAARLAQLLARFAGRRHPVGDRRAVASLWAKHHFATLLPPFLALALIAEREIDLVPDAIGCTFSPDGVTTRIHLRDAGRPAASADALARFAPLVDGHLEPLIRALSSASGVSRKVLWSSAGNMFDFIARRIERAIGPSPPVRDALALMAASACPTAGRTRCLTPSVTAITDRAKGSGASAASATSSPISAIAQPARCPPQDRRRDAAWLAALVAPMARFGGPSGIGPT